MELKKGIVVGSAKELASCLKCTDRMLIYYSTLRENPMPKLSRNNYDIIKCLRWHKDYEIGLIAKENEKLKNDEWANRNKKASALLKELELAELERELMRVDEMISFLNKIVTLIKTKLPVTRKILLPELLSAKDDKTVLKILEQKDNKFLIEFSNEIENITRSLAQSPDHN